MNEADKELISALDSYRRRIAELEASSAVQADENARLVSELNQARHLLDEQQALTQNLQIQLRDELIRDPLTGLYNRSYLLETIERETARSHRLHIPISILMINIDHFKRINDLYGHQTGDEVLKVLGKLLRSQLRFSDIVCRFAGEDFVVVMPGASIENAYLRAEHIRSEIAAEPIYFAGQEIYVSISLGAAAYPAHGKTGMEVLNKAEQALFLAKRAGRNQTMVSPDPE